MKKREQGILTVEASIVLTFFTLFALFLFSFVRIYRAENMVSHATLQAADAVALESYLRETALDDQAEDVVYLASRLTGSESLSANSFKSLRFTDILPSLAKEKFVAAVASSESNADKILNDLGVKDGLSGIDFSASEMDLDHDDVIVSVSYTLKMQFPILGANELSITKSAKAKTFGEILFEIRTESNNEMMGSATGGGNYQHGKTIQISAIPNSGYRFVKWDDGDTSNPRNVTVTEAHTYVAEFTEDGFGVEVMVNSPERGTVDIQGELVESSQGGQGYKYGTNVTVTANASPGYHFDKWIITKNKDMTSSAVNEPDDKKTASSLVQKVEESYTIKACFEPNTYTICVGTSGADGTVTLNLGSDCGTSLALTYGSNFTLNQNPLTGYDFKGWKMERGSSYVNPTADIPVPCYYGDGTLIPNHATITYTAYYEIQRFQVTVLSDGNGNVGDNQAYNYGSIANLWATPNDGFVFDYWEVVSGQQDSQNQFRIISNITYKAHFKCSGHDYEMTSHQGENCITYGYNEYICKKCHYRYTVKNNLVGEHDWGRCGTTHYYSVPVNSVCNYNSSSHKITAFQCAICRYCHRNYEDGQKCRSIKSGLGTKTLYGGKVWCCTDNHDEKALNNKYGEDTWNSMKVSCSHQKIDGKYQAYAEPVEPK